MYEIINLIISIFMRLFLVSMGIAFIYACFEIVSSTANILFPTRIILFGLTKEERRDVRRAWQDMSTRYKALKKMQSGVYSHLPDKKHPSNYGKTREANTLFNIFRSNSYLYIHSSGSSNPCIPQSYYDYTVHELTHTLVKILAPTFRERHYRTTLSCSEDDYKNSVKEFIESTMKKHGLGVDDILKHVTSYGTDPIETLSECMWIYLRLEADEELRSELYEDYQVVKIFINEFDQAYAMKML